MKEQLAKMTIIELVRTAHSYSTSIKQTGVYSELVREMASRLEALNLAHIGAMSALSSTEKDRDQLAAECAEMDAFVGDLLAIAWQGCNADGADIQGIALKHGLIRQEVYCQDQHENLVEDPSNFEDGDPVYFRVETPATDRFLAEQRALALDSLAGVAETMLIKFSNQLCASDMHEVVGWKMVMQQAQKAASQLRNEVKV